MIGFYKRYKQRKDKELADRIKARKQYRANLETGILIAKQTMITSPCAVNNMENCKEECTHFANGYVMPKPDFHGGIFYNVQNPKCKLWGAC